ncbi:MAG: PQQ-binding-like beta-propeller repeat protein [Candidatus Fermentibacteraceae bacterium]
MLSSILGTRGKAEKNAVLLIVLCAVAALVLILLIPGIRRGGADLSGSTSEYAVLPAQQPPAVSNDLPEVWPQAGFSSLGNPAWGEGVRAPFEQVWKLETGYEFFSAPVLLDNVLYVGCNDMNFRAIDAHSGSVLWSHPVVCGLSGGASGDATRIWFGGQDGIVYCLDRESGRSLWSTGLGYHVFSDAALFCDTVILAGTSMGGVAALHAGTGRLLWDRELDGLVLGPAVLDTVAVFVTESGDVAAFTPSGTVLWNRTFASQPSAPTISGSSVFIGFSSGKVLAFSLTGGETLWETQLPAVSGRTVVSRPVSAGSMLLAGTCDSRLVCLDRETGTLIWETSFENWMQVPPVVCDTLVYASCDDRRLHVISLNSGQPLESVELEGYSGTQPLIAGGVVYLGTAGGRFLALRGSPPDGGGQIR